MHIRASLLSLATLLAAAQEPGPAAKSPVPAGKKPGSAAAPPTAKAGTAAPSPELKPDDPIRQKVKQPRKKVPSLTTPDPKTGLDPVVAAQAQMKKQAKARAPKPKPVPPEQQVDLNSASKEQLMKLKGVDAATADRIIGGRPYPTKARLISGNIMPYTVYQENKDRMVARQPGVQAPKAKQ